jgi:hypothetical protein
MQASLHKVMFFYALYKTSYAFLNKLLCAEAYMFVDYFYTYNHIFLVEVIMPYV